MPPHRGHPAHARVEEQPEQLVAPANAMEQLAGTLWAFIRQQLSPQRLRVACEGVGVSFQARGWLAEKFLRLSPPSFTGEGNPEEAQY